MTALCFKPDCIQQVSCVQSAQELIDSAKSQLIGNCKALDSLEHKSGHLLPKNTDTFQAFMAAVAEWDSSLGLPQQIGELALRILHGVHIMQQVQEPEQPQLHMLGDMQVHKKQISIKLCSTAYWK